MDGHWFMRQTQGFHTDFPAPKIDKICETLFIPNSFSILIIPEKAFESRKLSAIEIFCFSLRHAKCRHEVLSHRVRLSLAILKSKPKGGRPSVPYATPNSSPSQPSPVPPGTDPNPNVPSEGSQAKVSKRRFPSQMSKAKVPERNIPSESDQAKAPKPNIPMESSQVEDPKRKLSGEKTQAKIPKLMIPKRKALS